MFEDPLGAPAHRSPRRPIRVFLAESHQLVLWGLQHLVQASTRPAMHLVGSAMSRADLFSHAALREADLVLFDLHLGGSDSSNMLPRLQGATPAKVLALSLPDSQVEQHRAAVIGGARGIVAKHQDTGTLLRAIEKVHQGELWLERGLLGDVLEALTGSSPPASPPPQDQDTRRIASLTPREHTIVRALGAHPCAKQLVIAEQLGITEHTLRNHLTTIYSKLGVRGRMELHLYATTHHLIN